MSPPSASQPIIAPQPSKPVSKDNVDKAEQLVRLVGFQYDPKCKQLFKAHHRTRVHLALGAMTTKGRGGQQPTVIRRIIAIFRNAILTHRMFPTFNVESQRFWDAATSDIRKEIRGIPNELNVGVITDIVGTYTQAYVDGHEDEMKKDDATSNEEDDFDVSKPLSTSADPRKILQPLVRTWARIFRKHKLAKQDALKTHDDASQAPEPQYPVQLPNESNTTYIARLQRTIATNAKEITALKHIQEIADDHSQGIIDRLHATLERTDAKLKDALADVDDGPDSRWVPYNEYADELDIASDTLVKGDGDGEWYDDLHSE